MAYDGFNKDSGTKVSNKESKAWKWGQDAFVSPEELCATVIESRYDKDDFSKQYIQRGALNTSSLFLLKETLDKVIVNSGYYSIKGERHLLMPDECYTQIITAASTELSMFFDNTIKPILRLYKRDIDNSIKIYKDWRYCPEWSRHELNLTDVFNFYYSITYTLELDAVPSVSLTQTLKPASNISMTGYDAYYIPVFPVVSVTDAPQGSILDKMNGILYVTEDTVLNSITYTAAPIFCAKPKHSISSRTTLNLNETFAENNFLLLKNA